MRTAATRLGDTDTFLWHAQDDPQLRATIATVLVLDREPDLEMLAARADHLSRVVPGMRHRLVAPPLRLANPRFVVDPDFDLAFHVRHVEAPQPKDLSSVLRLAALSAMSGLDRQRPLWEFTVVSGLEGGRAALVQKIDHILMDGVGAMQIGALLFDTSPDGRDLGPLPPAPETETITTSGLLREAAAVNAGRAIAFARNVAGATVRGTATAVRERRGALADAAVALRAGARMLAPTTATMSPLMTARHGWLRYETVEVPLGGVRASARACGATVNDVFLGAVTSALARYHRVHGAYPDALRVAMPVSLRRPGDPLGGNRVTAARFVVPIGIGDPAPRIAELHERARAARFELAQPLSNAFAPILNVLPTSRAGSMLKHVDFMASNVPGVAHALYAAGARVESFYGFGPLLGTAVNTTLVSYLDTAFVGVNCDAGAVPDGDVFVDCLREGFEEVLALAGDQRGRPSSSSPSTLHMSG